MLRILGKIPDDIFIFFFLVFPENRVEVSSAINLFSTLKVKESRSCKIFKWADYVNTPIQIYRKFHL